MSLPQKRVRKLNYHYNEYIKKMTFDGKRIVLAKLKNQTNKYSGNRGETILEKIKFIEENYPEVLI